MADMVIDISSDVSTEFDIDIKLRERFKSKKRRKKLINFSFALTRTYVQ